MFTCLDAIDRVEWSSDSCYIMCAQYKRRIVQVWSVTERDWQCKIDEGLAGLTYACWYAIVHNCCHSFRTSINMRMNNRSPDGRHIITATEFQLRLTIWSLVRKSVSYIKFPKYSDRGISFSADGRYMSVVERKEFKDYIGIYHCETWELLRHFAADTEDLYDVIWSPDSRTLACVDNCLTYNIVVYTPDGRLLAKYQVLSFIIIYHMMGLIMIGIDRHMIMHLASKA